MILPFGVEPAIIRFTLDYRVIDVNESFCRQQGKPARFFRGNSFVEFIAKPWRELVVKLGREVARQQRLVTTVGRGYELAEQRWVRVKWLLKPVVSRRTGETIEFKGFGWRL